MLPIRYLGLVAVLAAAPAFGQTPPQSNMPGGPPVPGVCMLSQQAVYVNAKVGVAATERLKQLAAQLQAGLTPEANAIVSDDKALEAQGASLKPADYQQRRQALIARAQAQQEKGAQENRQIELTRQRALARIAAEAQPVVAQVYKAHNCGLLLDRNAVLGGNMSGDLTAAVVQGLDAKITTMTFDLEPLPAAPAN